MIRYLRDMMAWCRMHGMQKPCKHWWIVRNWRWMLLPLLLAACAKQVVRAPVTLPALPPLQTAGATHYRINALQSHIVFLVYRAGPLAAFGHNHVIRAAAIRGDVYFNPRFELSGFSFNLPVGKFKVDEPAERKAAGADFDSQPSPAAITGTTHNMLGPALLDVAQYPEISVRSVRVEGVPAAAGITLRINLRGAQRDVTVPVVITATESTLTASGAFTFRQSDFGITPFSVLGGGLQVADAVKVRFRIVAVRPRD
ncbi:MAG TPA: YceI family protein [Gammaproteobacteria bacterium]|nr:YceI family protein [Gammaproteobacteria bacterium]